MASRSRLPAKTARVDFGRGAGIGWRVPGGSSTSLSGWVRPGRIQGLLDVDPQSVLPGDVRREVIHRGDRANDELVAKVVLLGGGGIRRQDPVQGIGD